MPESLSENDRIFLDWESKTENFRWNYLDIGVHPHDIWGLLYSSHRGIQEMRRRNAEQLRQVLQFESPIVEHRLANASFTSSLVFVPEIVVTLIQDDGTRRSRLLALLDKMFPELERMIGENIKDHNGTAAWVRESLCGLIRSAGFCAVDDTAKQVANGMAFLLHKHALDKAEQPAYPYPELPYWLPAILKQGRVVEATSLNHEA